MPITRAELPGLVREIIMNDPDLIMDALKKLRENQASKSKQEMKDSLSKHKEEFASDTVSPAVGPKDATVTIVEFFDYHCGYCKQMLPTITKLLETDKKVRVVFREFPILSEDSVTAARAAIAVYRLNKDKYFPFHSALMAAKGKFDEATLMDTAKKLGIDTGKLKKEMENPEITAQLDKNRQLAEDIGIRGTPALIVGDELYPGAMPYEDLLDIVTRTRSPAKTGN
jgi:protein-disulfide isomerase